MFHRSWVMAGQWQGSITLSLCRTCFAVPHKSNSDPEQALQSSELFKEG